MVTIKRTQTTGGLKAYALETYGMTNEDAKRLKLGELVEVRTEVGDKLVADGLAVAVTEGDTNG